MIVMEPGALAVYAGGICKSANGGRRKGAEIAPPPVMLCCEKKASVARKEYLQMTAPFKQVPCEPGEVPTRPVANGLPDRRWFRSCWRSL
jgi:hypothetical protein